MKTRKTLLQYLKNISEECLFSLLSELEGEIREFYLMLDLYYNLEIYVKLFDIIYLSKEKMTNLEIHFEYYVDLKKITIFVKDTEDFTRKLIQKKEKYLVFRKYIHK